MEAVRASETLVNNASQEKSSIFLGLLFDTEDGGDMFLRNVGVSEMHGFTYQKIELSTVTAMRTSNPTHVKIQFTGR
jgi:hypothetical protein